MMRQGRHELVGPPGEARGWRIAQVGDLHLRFRARKLRAVEEVIAVIVSRGLGDTLPRRIGVPREVVIVDLMG